MEMNVTSLGEDLLKVALTGRLDSPGVDEVEAPFLTQLLDGHRHAVIDLSAVDFVSSMGIRMLLSAAKGMRGRQFRLVLFGLQPRVRQVFDAVALPQIVTVRDTEDAAVAAVNAGA